MKHYEIRHSLIDLYPQIYKEVTGNPKYKFSLDSKKLEQIDKFCQYCVEKKMLITTEFLIDYLRFSFGCALEKENPWGAKYKFPLNWIIAKSVLDNFLSSSLAKKYVVKKNLRKRGFSNEKLTTNIEQEKELKYKKGFLTSIRKSEEIEKQRFFNTKKGLLWCIDNTSLMNPKSPICSKCSKKEECSILLKDNYPNIYKLRMNG